MSMPCELNAYEAAAAIQQRRLTSEELVRSCLARIRLREPEVHAWAAIEPDSAIAQARNLDREPPRSKLHGIPIGVKDVIDVRGFPTRCNSPIYQDHFPQYDAEVVKRAREAGMIVLGKTTTQEFATRGLAPATRNPHGLAHTPGGSSSGSAAAVADFMVPLAISTQTAGSIIRPASYCGIVGYKPGFQRIDTSGMKLISPSLDTVGIHARSVKDAALALRVLSRGMNRESAPAPRTEHLRLALCRSPFWDLAEPAARGALAWAAQRIAVAGLHISELTLPPSFTRLGASHDTISDYEACRQLIYERRYHSTRLSAGIHAKLARGDAISEAEYIEATQIVRQCRDQCAELLRQNTCMLTLSAPGLAPAFSTTEIGSSSFSKLWTTLGLPSISLPLPSKYALPIGVQLVAGPGLDLSLLQAAQDLEAILSCR